jgi:hypothetical protein
MGKEYKQKMKKQGKMSVLHGIVIPCIILFLGGFLNPDDGLIYPLIGLAVAVLWNLIVGRWYLRKFNKLKQEKNVDKLQ